MKQIAKIKHAFSKHDAYYNNIEKAVAEQKVYTLIL